MCGIVGVVSQAPVNQLIYDALLLLQHRGQDAAGIVTEQGRKFFMHKAKGMVRDVFRTRNMRSLPGHCGLGQVRYPTAGNAYSEEEAQPFYVNAPFGLVLVHNGNLTNAQALKQELFQTDHRHINTDSDSEVLLNVLAHELEKVSRGITLKPADVFAAVRGVHQRIRGSYAVVALIAGHGLLAFRDPYGIRPLCIGRQGDAVMVASESVSLDGTGFAFERDLKPGEAVYVDLEGHMHAQVCADNAVLKPCIFEYVYLARPDSVMDGVSVYQARYDDFIYLADTGLEQDGLPLRAWTQADATFTGVDGEVRHDFGDVGVSLFGALFSHALLGQLSGDFATQAERDYLFGDRDFNTVYEQTIISGYVTGDLFELPAGPVGVERRAAVLE